LRSRADLFSFVGFPAYAAETEGTRFLRELRDGGMLIADPKRGRLTRRVRIERKGFISRPSMYVLKSEGVDRARKVASAFAAAAIPEESEKRRRPAFRIVAL
jgi:hypothetical protein